MALDDMEVSEGIKQFGTEARFDLNTDGAIHQESSPLKIVCNGSQMEEEKVSISQRKEANAIEPFHLLIIIKRLGCVRCLHMIILMMREGWLERSDPNKDVWGVFGSPYESVVIKCN